MATIKNVKLGGTDWIDGEDVTHTDINDTFNATVENMHWLTTIYSGNKTVATNVMACTSAIWQTNQRRTANSGDTWSASALIAGGTWITCDADSTSAAGLATNGASGKYTSDSWGTINTTSTPPPNPTAINDISFPTTGVAVAVGLAAANVNIWRSTDGGDNWAQASSGPSGAGADDELFSVDMFDATYGVAVAEDGSIWYTDDGGDNWTDSAKNFGTTNGGTFVLCLSAAAGTAKACIVLEGAGSKGEGTTLPGNVWKNADLTGNGTQVKQSTNDSVSYAISNLAQTTNGNIYYIVNNPLHDMMLWRSTDSGDTWQVRGIGFPGGSQVAYATSLVEYDTNKLLHSVGYGVVYVIDDGLV